MGLFSKLFKKNISVGVTSENSSTSNPECLKLFELKKYMDMLLSENQYIPKSGYRNRLLEDKKTIEYFAVLDNSGMLKSFCDSNKIDVSAVETTLNRYRNFEAKVDAHNEEYIQRAMKSEKTYLDNILHDVDPKIKLDDDQRRVILTDEDYCLVIAGAGAGKTTITNLINRFYDIQKGSITYDGIDVKLIEKDSLRRSLGIVLQDTHLFTGTIAENIAYGRADATREEILEAARIANVDSFVQHLDNGYDTVLTDDGAGLSNGQRQLIAIARAALANAPVLILDEATSSIDSRTEKMVQEGMDRLMEGRTVFVIAHRLSTIVNSDVIMVMDHGRIIERGDHDSLMEQGGTYYRLYTGGLEID